MYLNEKLTTSHFDSKQNEESYENNKKSKSMNFNELNPNYDNRKKYNIKELIKVQSTVRRFLTMIRLCKENKKIKNVEFFLTK